MSFSKLKRRSTDALENGKENNVATTLRKFGYIKVPVTVFLSSLFSKMMLSFRQVLPQQIPLEPIVSIPDKRSLGQKHLLNMVSMKKYYCKALFGNKNSIACKTGFLILKRDLIWLTSSTKKLRHAFLTFKAASQSLHSINLEVALMPR